MTNDRRMARAHANGRNQGLTARVQPLFWRESDLSLPKAGFARSVIWFSRNACPTRS